MSPVNAIQPLPVRAYSCAIDIGVSFDHSALALLVRLAGIKQLNPGHDDRPVYMFLTKIWDQGTPLNVVVDEAVEVILRWRPRVVALEPLGVGAMPSQEIRRQAGARLPRVHSRKDATQWLKVNTTRQLKLASFGALLWGIEREQIVLAREPEVLRQLAGMRLSQSARGGASLDAEDDDVHDDIADCLAFAMLPRPMKRGIRCEFSRFASQRFGGPTLPVPASYGSPVVETGSGLKLFRDPVIQCVSGGAIAAPASGFAARSTTSPGRLSPQVQRARELLAAKRQKEETDGE